MIILIGVLLISAETNYKLVDSFNTSSSGNSAPVGITSNNTWIWILDTQDVGVYKYFLNGTYAGNFYNLSNNFTYPSGIDQNNTYFWVVGSTQVFQYDMEMNYVDNWSLTATNNGALGLSVSSEGIWITDSGNNLFKYYLNGTYTGTSKSTLPNYPIQSAGITDDGTYLWITEQDEDVVHKHWNTNGSYIETAFNITNDGNNVVIGIAKNDTHFWITDEDESFVRIYQIGDFSLGSLTINYPINEASYNSASSTFNVTATDDAGVGQCMYSLNGGTNTTMTNVYLPNGTYTGTSFDTSGSGNEAPVGITQNGTFIWITDKDDNLVYKYHMNGTYTGTTFDPTINATIIPDGGIATNGTYIWITERSGSAFGGVYRYHMNGTYTGYNFTFTDGNSEERNGLTFNGTYFWVIDDDYNASKYYANGTYTGEDISLGGATSGIKYYENFLWIINYDFAGDNSLIKKYLTNTSYSGEFLNISVQTQRPVGIEMNGTYIWILDSINDEVYLYHYNKLSNNWESTNSSMEDGNHQVTFYCNDTLGNLETSSSSFTIDTTKPIITINSISTTQGSQTFTFNATSQDTNLGSCWYSIFNSSGEIDGNNENISYTCNSTASPTASAYGTFNLTVYANDSAGNENSTTSSFTLTEAEGGGGGGGTVSFVEAEDFVILTINLNEIMDISLAKDSVKPRKKDFIIINNGIANIDLEISCSTDEANASTRNIDICEYVKFSETKINVEPNSLSPTKITVEVLTPEGSELGDAYYFNVLATSGNEFDKLSVSNQVTFLGQIWKWSELPNPSQKEDVASYPILFVALFLAFLVFIGSLVFFVKRGFAFAGFLISTFLLFGVFFGAVSIL